jgi:hypothetical protein
MRNTIAYFEGRRIQNLKTKKRGRPKREKGIAPTPETLAKLQPNVLPSLVYNGVIDLDQEKAAEEIAHVYHTLHRGLLPAGGIENDRSMATGTLRDPFARMTTGERNAWEFTYKPWANSESKKLIRKRPRLCRWKLSVLITHENIKPDVIAAQYQVDYPIIIQQFKNSLDQYVYLMQNNNQRSSLVR